LLKTLVRFTASKFNRTEPTRTGQSIQILGAHVLEKLRQGRSRKLLGKILDLFKLPA
jgi:hypothetical protein